MPAAKITKEWYEQTNANWVNGGKIYEIDEEATNKYYVDGEAKMRKRKAQKESDELLKGNVLKHVLNDALADHVPMPERNIPDVNKIKEAEAESPSATLQEMKALLDKHKIKYHHLAKEPKLTELLDQNNINYAH
ncbi:hypothetical protein [Maribacter sp.]|nr:hypothetical protein [Maribacter sp.]HDZ04841.1 hypothetical protein [Maribacter sp.]